MLKQLMMHIFVNLMDKFLDNIYWIFTNEFDFFGRNMDKEEMKARPYQLELLNKAIDENAIIYLGTGAGKTFIATSLIKEKMAGILHENKKTVFLCHRVPLVTQQAKFIKDNTPLTVRSFSGGIFFCALSCYFFI